MVGEPGGGQGHKANRVHDCYRGCIGDRFVASSIIKMYRYELARRPDRPPFFGVRDALSLSIGVRRRCLLANPTLLMPPAYLLHPQREHRFFGTLFAVETVFAHATTAAKAVTFANQAAIAKQIEHDLHALEDHFAQIQQLTQKTDKPRNKKSPRSHMVL